MKRVVLPILLIAVYMIALIKFTVSYTVNAEEELEQIHLAYAIDYASDAAIAELLGTEDLGSEYNKQGFLIANLEDALNTFVDVFLFNYDTMVNDANREYVELNFMPTFTVALYDGYYIAEHVRDEGLKFSPKLPYTYEKDGSTYALNMGNRDALKLDGVNLSRTATPTNSLEEITSIITNHMATVIDTENVANYDWINSFYIPSKLTDLTSVDPIEGPSVLTLVQGVNLNSIREVDAMSVAASRIVMDAKVVGYVRDGVNYYAYARKIPETIDVVETFRSAKEAALKGYAMDIKYME